MTESNPHGCGSRHLVARGALGFLHRRLVAYDVALELARDAIRLARSLPAGLGELRDQLVRSALAVPRHIAEAASRRGAADRRARFSVARGECAECDATLETLALLGAADATEIVRLQRIADRACALLTGLLCREGRRL